MLNNKLKSLILLMGVTCVAMPTIAAEQEQEDEDSPRLIITGSRIKRADMEGANPIQVITRVQLVATGITNMGDLLQKIPSVAGAGENANVNDKGSGAVRVSLRGLGAQRTLVLLNGRRMVGSGTGADSSVDMSSIPTSMVERIEVLKDGASAIYGSDAIAGVINIITRDDFEGLEFNSTYDASTKNGDGETKSFDLTLGASSEKGNVVVNAYYTELGPQWNRDRDWSSVVRDLNPDGTFELKGSSAPPWGQYAGIDGPFVDGDGKCRKVTRGAANGPGQSASSPVDTADGEFRCWDQAIDPWNYQEGNYHLTPSEKYGIFVAGNYEINNSLRITTELSFNRRESALKIAPASLAPLVFYGYAGAPYSADNYYNITQGPRTTSDSPLGAGQTVEIQDWRRRLVEAGQRDTLYQNDTVRAMFAIQGDLFDGDWDYEVYYSFGANTAITTAFGDLNFDKLAFATGPSFLDPATGQVVCGTVANPNADCVSLNIFGTPGTATAATQDMIDYISFTAQDIGTNEQQLIAASMSGLAYELPAGPVGVAFGIESRTEKGSDSPDALVALGTTSSDRTRTPTSGSYEVDEAYIEATIPIVESLDLDLAGRYSKYKVFGNSTNTTNYKVGIRWEPGAGLILRGTASTAFRAPSISNLFAGTSNFGPQVVDPCSVNPTPFCIADGVPPGGFTPLGAILSSTRGGNDKTEPEEADIYTVGLVYSPEFIEGVFLTLDYWNIEVTNAISTLGEQLILNSCAATGEHCDLIERSGPEVPSLYGNSSAINNRTINIGGVVSSGYDFSARYITSIEMGKLSVNLDSTFYDTYDVEQANGDIINNAGFFYDSAKGGDGNFPDWRTNVTVALTTDDWTASYAFRYIGEVDENWYVDNGTQIIRTIDSQLTQNVRFTYPYDENVTLTVGMNNVFDVDPPFVEGGFSDNTDPRTYLTTGRHAYVTVKLRF